jgi:hypothetical protein
VKKIDQRKRNSAETREKKAAAGRSGKDKTGFVTAARKDCENKLQERIEKLVSDILAKNEKHVFADWDVVLYNRYPLRLCHRGHRVA